MISLTLEIDGYNTPIEHLPNSINELKIYIEKPIKNLPDSLQNLYIDTSLKFKQK